MRQFARTVTAQKFLRSPFSGCRWYRGRSSACGSVAASRVVRIRSTTGNKSGRTPRPSPKSYSRFSPRCLKLLINGIDCNVTMVNCHVKKLPKLQVVMLDYSSLRRSKPPSPKTPEANSSRLPGSGTLVLVLELLVPSMLNASEGIDSKFSPASDGHPVE